MNKKDLIFIIFAFVLSIVSGIVTNDLLIGGITLLTSLLCAYYASKGKKINYIFGFINYLLMGYISYKHNLYGLLIFNTLIFAPLQIKGLINWNKNLKENNTVNVRKFTIKNAIIIVTLCILFSFFVGYLLSLIPGQRLAFLDASSNCINLCGIILMILRFKEAWWVWLVNNIIDLAIWVITVEEFGTNAVMMLLVSISYLLINLWGIYKWTKEANK